MKTIRKRKVSAIAQEQCTNRAVGEKHRSWSKVQIQCSWAHDWRSTAKEVIMADDTAYNTYTVLEGSLQWIKKDR